MKKQIWILILCLVILMGFGQTAQAVLQSVGPRDIPSPPGNGFPTWYQDTAGLTLDYCLPKNQAQLDAGACLILPPPAVPGFSLPFVFPTNYPDEAFFYNATAVMDLAAGFNAKVVLAVEGAFATGPVVLGDQITFGRLRIIVDAPVAGNYTVTTPYDVKVFPNVAVGKRAITFTSDIGAAVGDFTHTLQTEIGPFLRKSASEGGPADPFVTIPGDTSGDQFLSDTALPVFVTGSPTNKNYFEICTDSGVFPINGQSCVRVNQFTLMGRVFNGTPFNVTQSYYLRDASGTGTVNVFGLTSSVSATASYAVSGTGLTTTAMSKQIPPGNLYASIPFAIGTILPATVTTTATDAALGVADTVLSTPLVDLVVVSAAVYDGAAQTLTIKAASSDQAVPPTLTATGLGVLINGQLIVNNVIAPPASVTVTSSKGGTGSATVVPGLGGGAVVAKAARNDFDGDGKTDIAVWRPSDGNWYVIPSSTGIPAVTQWGTGTVFATPDVPVSGDYDGDGKADYAVWRPSDGTWYIIPSSTGIPTQTQWGTGTVFATPDVPVPGDYDGDGKTDIAVWRPSDGNWYIIPSSTGIPTQAQWGTLGDIPLP